MKKIFCMIIACCLIYTQAFGVTLLGSGVAAGGDGSIGQIIRIGGNSPSGNYVVFSEFTPTSSGTVSYGHARVGLHDGDEVSLTIFSATGVVLAYGSATVSTDDGFWLNVSLNTSVYIYVGTTYYLGINSTGAGSIYDDNSGTGNTDYVEQTYVIPTSDITPPGTNYSSDNLAIIFNNTPGDPI